MLPARLRLTSFAARRRSASSSFCRKIADVRDSGAPGEKDRRRRCSRHALVAWPVTHPLEADFKLAVLSFGKRRFDLPDVLLVLRVQVLRGEGGGGGYGGKGKGSGKGAECKGGKKKREAKVVRDTDKDVRALTLRRFSTAWRCWRLLSLTIVLRRRSSSRFSCTSAWCPSLRAWEGNNWSVSASCDTRQCASKGRALCIGHGLHLLELLLVAPLVHFKLLLQLVPQPLQRLVFFAIGLSLRVGRR